MAKEKILIKASLNDSEVLVMTDERIMVYKNRKLELSLRLYDIRAFTPRDDSIIIHYAKESYFANPIKCDTITYDLVGRKFTSTQLCNKIFKEIIIPISIIENKTYLCLEPDEHIVDVYKNVLKHTDRGTLYITNFRVIFEADIGTLYSLDFDLVAYVETYNKGVDIQWDYPLANLNDPIRHFRISPSEDVDHDSLSLLIRQQIAGCDLRLTTTFVESDKYYSNLESEEMYKLYRDKDRDLDDYITSYVKFVFGPSSPIFLPLDKKLILACKFRGWSIDLVSTLTKEEKMQRIFAKRIEQIIDFIDRNIDTIENTRPISGPIWSAPGYDPTQDIKDQEILATSTKLHKHNPEISEMEANITKIQAESLRQYDKRVATLYKEWCNTEHLQDFTDDYDDDWIKYLLERLDNSPGLGSINPTVVNYEELEEKLTERDKNRITLANFSAPDHISDGDIYNNCWYDRRDQMWYIQNDNLPESMYSIIDWDPDKSEKMIGRRVWGIQRHKVRMFCGYPCLQFLRDTVEYQPLATSRKTGQHSRLRMEKIGNHVIPILRETDITSKMRTKQGALVYTSTEINYTIMSTGNTAELTPKMTKFLSQRYGFADVPLNERVRRALFSADTNLFFDPRASSGDDPVEPPAKYPNAIIDERYG